MTLLVQKYGGTSVGTPDRILHVAARVARTRKAGHDLVVVVSAMGQSTDQLIELARAVHPDPPQREMDMLLTAGERVSMALLAMALRREGIEAISFTGSQSGIITDSVHGRARILKVRGDRIRQELSRGRVVIVAGFQGVSRDREITTLGRGGSDTTAVALAGALGAECCEIYTDVPGVMTADPRCVPAARLIPALRPLESLTLTALGAGVLVPRAAALGCNLRVPIVVRSSWDEGPGTRISEEETVETQGVAAVTCTAGVVVLQLPEAEAAVAGNDVGILALAQGAPGGPVTVAVAGADAAQLQAGSAAAAATGDLVSLVSHGSMTLGIAAAARIAAAEGGFHVTRTFAGPCSFSALVPSGEGEGLTKAWHGEFIED